MFLLCKQWSIAGFNWFPCCVVLSVCLSVSVSVVNLHQIAFLVPIDVKLQSMYLYVLYFISLRNLCLMDHQAIGFAHVEYCSDFYYCNVCYKLLFFRPCWLLYNCVLQVNTLIKCRFCLYCREWIMVNYYPLPRQFTEKSIALIQT